jgi:hypothetical protein
MELFAWGFGLRAKQPNGLARFAVPSGAAAWDEMPPAGDFVLKRLCNREAYKPPGQ